MTLSEHERTMGARSVSDIGRPSGHAVNPAHGERSEEHTSELQSRLHLVCRLLLENNKMYFMLFVNRTNIAIAGPLMQHDLNLSNTKLGLSFSDFAYPYAIFQLVGYMLGDTFCTCL